MYRIKPIHLVVALGLLLMQAGCRTSASYRFGISAAFPAVADRMEKYAPTDPALPPQIQAVRDAALDPITFEKGSAAWKDIEPGYRTHIEGDDGLDPFIRTEYLLTADKLDELHEKERARRLLFFIP